MMTFEEMVETLSRYTYKPGWKMTLWLDPIEGIFFYLLTVQVDSYDPDKTVELGIGSWVPPMMNADQFESWIFWRLRMIEIHEVMEWFKKDGNLVCNPHSGDRNPTGEEVEVAWSRMQREKSETTSDPAQQSTERSRFQRRGLL